MPAETHERYDAAGKLTGTTVVRRESEWTETAQTRALALIAWEAGKCPSCGNWDALRPLRSDTRHVRWAEHDGEVAEVAQYRCIYCGAADLIRRDVHARFDKREAQTGKASPLDGRMFIARPPSEEGP